MACVVTMTIISETFDDAHRTAFYIDFALMKT
jgi:hypothetical protein